MKYLYEYDIYNELDMVNSLINDMDENNLFDYVINKTDDDNCCVQNFYYRYVNLPYAKKPLLLLKIEFGCYDDISTVDFFWFTTRRFEFDKTVEIIQLDDFEELFDNWKFFD